MQLTEEMISHMSQQQLLDRELLLDLYDLEDIEHYRYRGLLQIRAKELKCSTTFSNMLKVLDKEVKTGSTFGMRPVKGVALSCNSDGKPLNTIENFLSILRADEYFSGLQFNKLNYSPEKTSLENGTERWTDADDSLTRDYIEKNYKMHNQAKLDDALRIRFKETEYHPIKQIIEAVEWDGVPRIQTLFIKWLKCEDTPYVREVTRLVFAGGIHRLYNPGCKFDDVCVLIGTKQGEGKSSFVRWLAINDEYFTEVNDFEGEKAMQSLEGAWICEISELLALTKTKDVEAAKAFITRLNDRRKIPYDRRVTDHKRQCIFIGTTNREQFLTDKTGNRRWYPVKVNSSGYDLHDHKEEIQADIIQTWAEAKHLYDEGKLQPYADRNLLEDIRKMQSQAVEDDYRVGMIENYIKNKDKVCILELWKYALDNEFSKPTRRESNELTLILQSIGGWERGKVEYDTRFGSQLFWHNKNEKELPPIDVDDLPI